VGVVVDADRSPAVAVDTRRRIVAALTAAMATAALYSVGVRRAFGYDAALTVQNFVRTPSVWDPWRRQVVFNNHPLFSFLERLVFATTGSSSEMVMRVLPVLFAGAAVGATVWFLSEHWPLGGSLTGGLLMAVNPVLLGSARDVRGYGLMVLCAVLTTAMVIRTGRRSRTVYAFALAAGATAHVYLLAVVPVHALLLAVRRAPVLRWVPVWAVGVVAAALAFLPSVPYLGARGRMFRPGFPAELLRDALGAAPAAMLVTALLVVVAAWRARRYRSLVLLGAVMVTSVWVYGPFDLYPRFFVWAVPLLALAVAVATARDRRLMWLGLVAVGLTLAPQIGALRGDELANRSGGRLLAAYDRPCVAGWSGQAMGPYWPANATQVARARDYDDCDAVLVLIPRGDPALVDAARTRFRQQRVVPARTPALLFSDPATQT
jgi:hypothetical protein